jgi:hypothetical protein
VGAAREIFLDDVVLRGALQLLACDALLVGQRHIERQKPGRRRVDGHRGVHVLERDLLEQRAHVAEMRDRHADLSDLARGERMIAVVAGLRRQIEGDGEAGLTLGEVLAIERVRLARGRMAGVGAEDPGAIAARPRAARWLAHGRLASPPRFAPGDCAMHHTPAKAASTLCAHEGSHATASREGAAEALARPPPVRVTCADAWARAHARRAGLALGQSAAGDERLPLDGLR